MPRHVAGLTRSHKETKYRFASNRRGVHESRPIPMKNPARLLLLPLLLLGAATGFAQALKPGYTVVTEITFNEQGAPEDAKIVQSDDPTGDHTLEQLAMNMSEQDKQTPRLKDGKPVKFKARRPFSFPVADDQGEAANANRPVLRAGHQDIPVYPEDLAAKGEIGGAIVELAIQADGKVQAIRALRASHPEFAASAIAALAKWTFMPDESPGAPAVSHWRAAVGFTMNGRNLDLKWRLAPRPSIGSFTVGRLPPSTAPVDMKQIPLEPVPAPAVAPADKK